MIPGAQGNEGMSVPPHPGVPHYHGRIVRALFLIGALILIVAQSTGADLPLSTFGTVFGATVLVIAAGITNPNHFWIHWLNALLAVLGALIFGTSVIERYRDGARLFESSFAIIEGLALMSLIALYFTTRTIRGIYLRRTRHTP
jgi:hypothetical protein